MTPAAYSDGPGLSHSSWEDHSKDHPTICKLANHLLFLLARMRDQWRSYLEEIKQLVLSHASLPNTVWGGAKGEDLSGRQRQQSSHDDATLFPAPVSGNCHQTTKSGVWSFLLRGPTTGDRVMRSWDWELATEDRDLRTDKDFLMVLRSQSWGWHFLWAGDTFSYLVAAW